jgi:predicted MFS family arabinose efflux permease
MYRICAVVALLLVTNVSSLEVHPTKRVTFKSGSTVRPITSRMTIMRSANSHSRLPNSNSLRRVLTSNTRIQQSFLPVDYARRRSLVDIARDSMDSMSPNRKKSKRFTRRKTATEKKIPITKMDVCLFATYFLNMIAVTLSVVTVPALAAEYFSGPHATAAFVAGVASMAPLGGGFGKIINGFVCQRMGGRRSSWLYLVALAVLSLGMSVTTSAAPIGFILMGYEFLSSIQWTSLCYVMAQKYKKQPELMARGIAIISLASTLGALAAKTFGAALLQATNWRVVTQCGAGIALLGAMAMKLGVSEPPSESIGAKTEEKGGGIAALKLIVSSPLFWQIGMAHSLGYLARGNDRLLGSFLEQVSNLPRK